MVAPRIGMVIGAALAIVACEKKEETSPPAAEAKPATPAPAAAPLTPDASACGELTINVEPTIIRYERGAGRGEVPEDGLVARLRELATACVGPARIAVADDVSYQDIVTVMDAATSAGFVDIGLGKGDGAPPATPGPAATDREALARAPVIVVKKATVEIGGKQIAKTSDDVAKAVEAALAATGAPPGVVILQADAKTAGRTINQVIDGAKKAGYGNVLMAVKTK